MNWSWKGFPSPFSLSSIYFFLHWSLYFIKFYGCKMVLFIVQFHLIIHVFCRLTKVSVTQNVHVKRVDEKKLSKKFYLLNSYWYQMLVLQLMSNIRYSNEMETLTRMMIFTTSTWCAMQFKLFYEMV